MVGTVMVDLLQASHEAAGRTPPWRAATAGQAESPGRSARRVHRTGTSIFSGKRRKDPRLPPILTRTVT
jgi:hypothetical protein